MDLVVLGGLGGGVLVALQTDAIAAIGPYV